MNLFKLSAVLFLGFIIYKGVTSYFYMQFGIAQASKIPEMLEGTAQDWNVASLSEYMDAYGLDGKKDEYQAMLTQASHIGQFQACEEFTIEDYKPSKYSENTLKEGVEISGECRFKTDKAYVSVIFADLFGKVRMMDFKIKPRYSI